MDSNGAVVDEQMKLVQGAAGYVLEDVPHLTDYILDLPVLLPSFLPPLFTLLFLRNRSFFSRSSVLMIRFKRFITPLDTCANLMLP